MKTSLSLSVSSAGGKKRPPIIPVVTAISPSTRYTGGGQSVTLTGTGLKHPTGTTVTVGGTSATVVSSSWHSLTFTTPAKTAATYDVVVTNALGSSTPISLTYVAVATADLTSISPTYGPASGGTTVTATGTFVPEDLAFTVNGIAATGVTYVNSTTATFVTPAQADVNGSYDVVVSMYGVSNTDILGSGFTARRVPVVTSLNVTKGPIAGSTTVQVTGQYFVSATYGTNTVVLDGQDVACTYVSSTRVDFTTPAHAAGAVTLAVRNVGGTSNTLANAFTYYAQPTITASDTSPKTYAQAARLTVSNSTDITGGTLGGTSLTGVSIVDATHVDVTFPAKSAGTYNLVLTGHPGGTTPNFSIATVNTAIVATSVTPNTDDISGGTSLSIVVNHANLGNATSVTIDGNTAANFAVVDDTHITCDAPAALVAGIVSLVVGGPAGLSNALPFEYTSSAWTPLDYGTGSFWLDGDDPATITTATGVALWVDKGDLGLDLEQATGSKQPAYNASDSAADNRGTVTTNAAAVQTMTSVLTNLTHAKFSIFFVVGTLSGARLYSYGDGSRAFGAIYMSGTTNGLVQDVPGHVDIITATGDLYTPADDSMRVIEHQFDVGNATHKIFVNGVDVTAGTYFENGVDSSARANGVFHLAQYQDGTESLSGKFAEILGVVDRIATGPERTATYNYLAAKYPSIPITVP